MITVGAFDAKTRLSELLDAVERGDVVTITRHGRPVAELRRAGPPAALSMREALAEARALRLGVRATGEEIESWIEEGRS
ncbi:MAG: type II toxin-antitoxin system prevent-host-death family antitoxin [Deltaproteobacteria bacterium]|nr:type II toxin-antitoxin system prevent-host-death family antitoxin [Deltaproteobacteria bacterium]